MFDLLRSRAWLPLLLALFALQSCSCDDDKVTKVAGATCKSGHKSCKVDLECKDHESCADEGGDELCCNYGPRICKESPDCCPGQICKRDKKCFDQRVECPNGDTDCGDPGSDRVCLDYTDRVGKTLKVCGYAACDENVPCAEGRACFKGFCVAAPPCNGRCEAGSVCLPQTNECWGYGQRCSQTCGPGFLSMLKDPSNIWDSCDNRKVECECAELPTLLSTDLGRYASSTTVDGKIATSMYDGQYGDLVVQFRDATGVVTKTEYVDGIPSDGTVIGGPSGARGGVAEPGDDVGLYTSIAALSDGTLVVSYFDQTNKDLKFATRTPGDEGTWSVHTVESTGEVGLYTSISIDPTGKPAIAYFQRAGATGGTSCPAAAGVTQDLITGVKLARAKVDRPGNPSDWSVQFVECGSRTKPPCYGCTANQTCVEDSVAKGLCATTAAGCSGCTSAQVCAITTGAASCKTPFTEKPLLDIPSGVGLFPSLAFKDSNAVVAWYDAVKGELRAASGTTSFTPVTLDGAPVGALNPNIGLFPSVAIEPTGAKRICIAYHDATGRSLKFLRTASLTTPPSGAGTERIIDTGLAPPTGDGPSFVGANVSLKFAADGKLYAAYQNSTANDLRVAVLDATGKWVNKKTFSQGALGFFSDIEQLPDNSNLFVTHTRLHTKLLQNRPTKDNTPRVEMFVP